MVAEALCATHGWKSDAVEIHPVVASGDKVLDRPLAEIGGKALWTKELDRALLEGNIDFAVHSMKDVETIRPDDLVIAAMLPRADVRDRLVGTIGLAEIRPGGVVGTSSPRRAAQVRRARPDLSVTLFRGNVQTRLAKLEAGEVDATLLAAAGLDRLAMGDIGVSIECEAMLPAPAQGAIGVECLGSNEQVRALLGAICDRDTYDCVMAERALLLALGGSCHSPIAALALAEGDALWLRAEILSVDGSECHQDQCRMPRGDAAAPVLLAERLLGKASTEVRKLFLS